MRHIKAALLALVMLLCAGPALAAPSVVQSDATGRETNSASQTVNSANLTTTIGNTLVGILAVYNASGAAPNSVTDTPNGSYTNIISNVADPASITAGAWYFPNAAALSVAPITGHATSPGNWYQSLAVMEVGGVTATPLDLHPAITTTSSTATPSVSFGTAASNTIALAFIFGGSVTGSIIEASGWTTMTDTYNISGYVGIHTAWKAYAAGGTVTYNPTLPGASVISIGGMTFKGTSAASANYLMPRPIP